MIVRDLLTWISVSAFLLAGSSAGAAEATAGAFEGSVGLGWRVRTEAGAVMLARTRDVIRHRRSPPGAYLGAADPVVTLAFGSEAAPVPTGASWVRRVWRVETGSGPARVSLSRLSPAVLVETPEAVLRLAPPKPAATEADRAGAAPRLPERPGKGLEYLAWVEGGKVVVAAAADLGAEGRRVRLDEPWLLGWFGSGAPALGHARLVTLDSGAGVILKRMTEQETVDRLDVPVLVRLEHRPQAIAREDGGVVLRFGRPAGKAAVLPLVGRRVVLPEETEAWADGLPDDVLAACRRWSRVLRDWPAEVTETAAVEGDAVALTETFTWESLADDWSSPAVKAAPLPPMLTLALGASGDEQGAEARRVSAPAALRQRGGGARGRSEDPPRGDLPADPPRETVTFATAAGGDVRPVGYGWMGQFGKAMAVEGTDAYTWRVDLAPLVSADRKPVFVAAATQPLRERLEAHVAAMLEAGRLRPLLFIHGGVGTDWYATYYWLSAPEHAYALARAWPYLPPRLRERIGPYLADLWQARPPLTLEPSHYEDGAARTPYAMDLEGVRLFVSRVRDTFYRRRSALLDVYRLDYARGRIDGLPPVDGLRQRARQAAEDLAGRSDWAILGPARLKEWKRPQEVRWLTLQGSAAYNNWLAGAAGLVRMARAEGWQEEARLGAALAAKFAMARLAQARYVHQMHAAGLVRGEAADDFRAVSHVDAECVLVRWGPITTGVMEDQAFPPFADLTPEVGRWLGTHARSDCRRYLDYLDAAVPYWYLSEAPKQSATEHRLCPLWHQCGTVPAQAWVLGKRREAYRRYVDATRFTGDLYYIENLVTGIEAWAE
jgi:hypothetical protein